MSNTKFYLAYLTANDFSYFHWDYLNFLDMVRHDPGVELVRIYAGISLVRPWSKRDEFIVRCIMRTTNHCKWLKPEVIILKENIGRDFSSLKKCLQQISMKAQQEDFIMVRNRSSRGPYSSGWYEKFIDQFKKIENTGLVGNTINVKDHYTRKRKMNIAHIQSYAYLSQWKYLSLVLKDLPGQFANSRLEAILDGEIEFSQQIMDLGLRITSLMHPDLMIDKNSQNEPMMKGKEVAVKELPFVHKGMIPRNTFQNAVRYASIIRQILKKDRGWRIIDHSSFRDE